MLSEDTHDRNVKQFLKEAQSLWKIYQDGQQKQAMTRPVKNYQQVMFKRLLITNSSISVMQIKESLQRCVQWVV